MRVFGFTIAGEAQTSSTRSDLSCIGYQLIGERDDGTFFYNGNDWRPFSLAMREGTLDVEINEPPMVLTRRETYQTDSMERARTGVRAIHDAIIRADEMVVLTGQITIRAEAPPRGYRESLRKPVLLLEGIARDARLLRPGR